LIHGGQFYFIAFHRENLRKFCFVSISSINLRTAIPHPGSFVPRAQMAAPAAFGLFRARRALLTGLFCDRVAGFKPNSAAETVPRAFFFDLIPTGCQFSVMPWIS